MGKVDRSQFQGHLIGQIIAAAIGTILLVVGDFAGFYYGGSYVRTWGYVCFLGCGFGGTLIILVGILGLLFALYSAFQSLQAKEDPSPMFLKENARKAMLGGGFTAVLALVGAIVFIITNLDADDWWLDDGFYGAFFGGLFTAVFGKLMFDKIEV